MKTFGFIAFAAAGAAMLASAAAADNLGPKERRFDRIDTIVIDNFTGRIEVKIGGDKVSASLKGGKVPFPLAVSQNGARLALEAPERPHNYDIYDEIHARRYGDTNKALEKFLADYPTLEITAPAGTALDIDDPISIASIGDLGGALTIDGGLINAVAGDVASADIALAGSGDIKLGAVKGDLNAGVHGSGDFDAKSVGGEADLEVHGSGDIRVGDIGGAADLEIHGSGNLSVGDIGGAVNAEVHGSGDLNAGKAGKGGDFSISGSGDVDMARLNGPAAARISGSGNVEIGGGRAENLKVSISGSGDFILHGVSTNLDVNVHGSGLVQVAKNEGSLNMSGDGHIRIGGVTIDNDD